MEGGLTAAFLFIIMPYPYLTEIKIMSDVPISRDYTDVLFFETMSEMRNKLFSLTKKTYTNMSYQRVKSSVPGGKDAYKVIVPENADILEANNCNYIAFTNTQTQNNWWFGFITDIGYNGENSSTITYEIDYFTSFIMAAEFHPCWVEREHSITDNPGDNCVPEPLSVNYYEINQENSPVIFSGYNGEGTAVLKPYIILCCADKEGLPTTITDNSPNMLSGEFNGCVYYWSTSASDIADLIQTITRTPGLGADIIQGVYMSKAKPTPGDAPVIISDEITVYPSSTAYKNKKMLTYPYRYFQLSSPKESIIIKPQMVNGAKLKITTTLTTGISATARSFPTNANMEGFNDGVNFELTSPCLFTKDSFGSWLAQNVVGLSIDSMANTLKIAGGALGNIGGFRTGSISGIDDNMESQGKIMRNMIQQYNAPNIARGSSSPSSLAVNMGDITLYTYEVNQEMGVTINNYFTMFGYATQKLKMPNLNSRPYWNYVKTNNCVVTGEIPTQAKRIIQDVFNRGVRLWHTLDVGNYNLDNAV